MKTVLFAAVALGVTMLAANATAYDTSVPAKSATISRIPLVRVAEESCFTKASQYCKSSYGSDGYKDCVDRYMKYLCRTDM